MTPAAPLVCEACGHEQEFVRQPLYCLAGPSGTGKSTVGRALLPRLADRFVVLEQDVLWVPELRDPTDHHRAFRTTWLRLAATIGQSGRPVLLCGTVVPPELEPLPERALFREVHYLALTCRADVLAARLRARPAWREWTSRASPRCSSTPPGWSAMQRPWIRRRAARHHRALDRRDGRGGARWLIRARHHRD